MKKTLFVMDIESTDFKEKLQRLEYESYRLEFKLGCSIQYDITNNQEIERFYSINQQKFQEYLIKGCNSKNKKIVYFHNVAFDSKFFIDFLYANFSYVEIMRTGGKIPSIRCYRERANKSQMDCVLEIRDSYTLLDGSIKVLGKAINLPKLDFDFNYETYNFEKALEYCFRDCEIPYYSITYLVKILQDNFHLINNRTKKSFTVFDLPLTIASVMKKIFLKYYPKALYKVDIHLENRIRPYYYGGRTDAFNFNKVFDASYTDANSMYANEMSKNNFANGKVYSYQSDIIEFKTNNSILAYEVELIENLEYPLYPTRINNKIFYIKGVKKAILTRKEYFWFKKHHYFKKKKIIIKEILREFSTKETITFKELFNDLYNLRNKHERGNIFNYIFKKLMASCHGKFAEKYKKECYKLINKELVKEIDFDTQEIYDIDNRLMERKEVSNLFIKINLFNGILTTSYARFKLWKMTQKCLKLGITVYYCDTDSLVISNKKLHLLEKYLSETILGKWKIEQNFTEFQALDSKEYYFRTKEKNFNIKFKGVKNEMLNSLLKLKRHYRKGTKVNLVGSVFYCFNRHSDLQNVFIIEKHKRSYYHKRIINNDLSTSPLTNYDLDNLDIIEQNNRKLLLQQLHIKESSIKD